jgi:hypothetical protein
MNWSWWFHLKNAPKIQPLFMSPSAIGLVDPICITTAVLYGLSCVPVLVRHFVAVTKYLIKQPKEWFILAHTFRGFSLCWLAPLLWNQASWWMLTSWQPGSRKS